MVGKYRILHQECIKEPAPLPSKITSESIIEYNKDFKNFHRFWSHWWLWTLLFPLLFLYMTFRLIKTHIVNVGKDYYRHTEKFRIYAVLIGVGHAFWRIPFIIWPYLYALLRCRAVWREQDFYETFDPENPRWFDVVYFYSFGLLRFRREIMIKYYGFEEQNLHSKAEDINVNEIPDGHVFVVSLLPTIYGTLKYVDLPHPYSGVTWATYVFGFLVSFPPSFICALFLIVLPSMLKGQKELFPVVLSFLFLALQYIVELSLWIAYHYLLVGLVRYLYLDVLGSVITS